MTDWALTEDVKERRNAKAKNDFENIPTNSRECVEST
jgi:hypothetical protein